MMEDGYERHFGQHPPSLTDAARNDVDQSNLKTSRVVCGKLGNLSMSVPKSLEDPSPPKDVDVSFVTRTRVPRN